MRIPRHRLILLLSISLFTIGCKTSESISKRKIEEVQEIESFEPTSTRDEYLDEVVSVREYAGTHRLGSREVSLKFRKKGDGLTFINLHDDENTSVKAAREVLDSIGGRLIELRHSGKRNILFTLNSIKYEFDPNRMFTNLGAEASLERFSRTSAEAHKLSEI